VEDVAEELTADWGNIAFVAGVSLAVVVAVLVIYPAIRSRFAGATPTKKE
jgi:hypothetical protein